MRIAVGIHDRLLESADGGRSWCESRRSVTPPTEPEVRGARGGLRPSAPTGWRLTHVHVGPEGIGFAAGYEPVSGDKERHRTARFWVTRDSGVTWQAAQPDLGFWGRFRAWPSWPPEEIDTVAVLAGGIMAFAWEDPWLFEGPHCHLVLSSDGGASWRYQRMPDGCCTLACGPGPLRVFGGPGLVVMPPGSRSVRREKSRIDWTLPPGYWGEDLPARHVQFTSEAEALAMAVSWPRESPPRPPEELGPPMVGLLRSEDGGRHWKGMNTWEAPRRIDLNVRHEITLDVPCGRPWGTLYPAGDRLPPSRSRGGQLARVGADLPHPLRWGPREHGIGPFDLR